MRIYISNFDDIENPNYAGGGAIAIHEMAKRLAQHHDVTVVTSAFANAKNNIRDGVTYERIGPPSMGGRFSQLLFQLSLPFLMQRKTFDIWIESFTPPFSTGFLPLFSNKPVVGLAHLLGGKDMAKKYNMPFHIIESFGLKFYSYLIAITDDLKTQIHRINPNAEVVVIPNGLVVTDEILAKDIPKKHILFIGRFDCYQKGIDLLLQAYSLSETQNSYPLVIAGQGNKRETQHLKSLIKQYGIENRVHLVGKVEGKTKENLFKESILTVAPSRFESFGLTLVEAFYYKSPVITFDIDGLKWIDATYCKKVPPFDIPALVKAMNELISNPTQRATYIKTSTEFVKQFNWDDATKKYETFLQYVHLAQSPAPKITPAIQPTK